jgi:hypothetical protein
VYRAEALGLDYRSDPHKDMYEWSKLGNTWYRLPKR